MKYSQVSFVVCGNFGPTRGFERLLANWLQCPSEAVLCLQGNDSEFKDYLKNLKATKILLRKKTLVFVDAVPVEKIIDSLKSYDVGIIPYEPVCLNNKYCFPNKTSQYLKAGLPIIANNLPAVERILNKTGAGISVNFRNRRQFTNIIRLYTNKRLLQASKLAAFNLHKHEVCWEKASEKFYDTIQKMTTSSFCVDKEIVCKRKASKNLFYEQVFKRLREPKDDYKGTSCHPLLNSRQLLFSLLCLLIAKGVFYFWAQLMKESPTHYPYHVLSRIKPTNVKLGVFERYDSIVKRILSPI
jgi:hypothetical protein